MAFLVFYCVTVCILLLDFECVTVSNVVFMEGTYMKCSFAGILLYFCDIDNWYWVLRVLGSAMFFYGRKKQGVSVAWLVLYCVAVFILVLVVECVTIIIFVCMEGRGRQCSVAGLVNYCGTVYVLVLGDECVTVINDVFMEGYTSSAVWQV